MSDESGSRYAPGRNPWDPINGFRVGALAGGIIGVLPVALLGGGYFWAVIAGAALGGVAGFWIEKRNAGRPVGR